jgi:hypothetical protein
MDRLNVETSRWSILSNCLVTDHFVNGMVWYGLVYKEIYYGNTFLLALPIIPNKN